MEFPPFSATTTGEKASQTDGFQSIRRINRYPLGLATGRATAPARIALRWLSKKCNFEPRASVSSVDRGTAPKSRSPVRSPV
jgi:hypothetical protein